MRIEPLGDSALLVRVVEDFETENALDAVLRTAEQLEGAQIPGVIELAPAYTTIGVFFESAGSGSFEDLKSKIEEVLAGSSRRSSPRAVATIEVPVCYDEEFGPDLGEIARWSGLPPEEVVRRHSGAHYRVSCVGFTPGFPYLIGLPQELATPRRDSPRKEVPAGAVAIGGTQTGIYPQKSPGGWNIIGRSPLCLFDVERDPPALFHAGDRVRFRRISRQEFDAFGA